MTAHKQTAMDDETIAKNVRDTLNKLRDSQSAGFPGKRLISFSRLSSKAFT